MTAPDLRAKARGMFELERALSYANNLNTDLLKEVAQLKAQIDRLEEELEGFKTARDA